MSLHPEVAENRPAIEAVRRLDVSTLTTHYLAAAAPADRLVVTDRPAAWNAHAVSDRDSAAVLNRVNAILQRRDPIGRPAVIVFDTGETPDPAIALAVETACRNSRKWNCRVVLRQTPHTDDGQRASVPLSAAARGEARTRKDH